MEKAQAMLKRAGKRLTVVSKQSRSWLLLWVVLFGIALFFLVWVCLWGGGGSGRHAGAEDVPH
jgi:hypothetical protein